jgi:hypothetical protein
MNVRRNWIMPREGKAIQETGFVSLLKKRGT